MPMRPNVHNPLPRVVQQGQARERDARERARHAIRMNSYQRGYNREWQRASRSFLQANPLCKGFDSACEAAGKVRPATEVDHVVPHKGDMRLFWNTGNWQGLCHGCHSSKTAREDGGFGRPIQERRGRARSAAPQYQHDECKDILR